MSCKILSFDGGGIRGLITALLIQNLDRDYNIVEKTDGFAGTSTGGLIALGLASGRTIDEIITIYKERGAEIFQPNSSFQKEETEQRIFAPTGELFSGPGFFSCQYTNTGLKKIAEELLGDKTLNDVEKLLVVNSAQLWDGFSWVPCALSNRNGYKNIKMVDAALATSAAPTYFPPYPIDSIEPRSFFVDGGTFANNPSMTAISEALSEANIKDIQVLSLGTGGTSEGIQPGAFGSEGRAPLDWGVSSWMWPLSWSSGGTQVPATALLNLTLDLTAEAASMQIKQILKDNYRRGNFVLQNPIALDDWRQVSELIDATQKYLRSGEWSEIRQWVKLTWT